MIGAGHRLVPRAVSIIGESNRSAFALRGDRTVGEALDDPQARVEDGDAASPHVFARTKSWTTFQSRRSFLAAARISGSTAGSFSISSAKSGAQTKAP